MFSFLYLFGMCLNSVLVAAEPSILDIGLSVGGGGHKPVETPYAVGGVSSMILSTPHNNVYYY